MGGRQRKVGRYASETGGRRADTRVRSWMSRRKGVPNRECVGKPRSIIIISVSPTPAVTQIVSAGENITLHCNISPSTEMVWYKHHHHELTMIISVQKGSLEGDLAVNHNQDPEHFLFSQNNSGYARSETMSLIIKGIRQSDIGFYYCGARQEGSHMKFGRAISLQFPDAVKYTSGSAACWTPLVSVCSALALMLTLCLGIIFKRGFCFGKYPV
ncbi:hypothetical protein C0J45_9901 [Silurus meridionalis]|nr:hypothetical protein C0J45_9901 [Silurus meridionalis]